MKTRFALYTVALMLLTALMSVAQEVPVAEVVFGYSLINVHPNIPQFTSFNLNGGGGAFVYNLTPWIGVKADLMGYTTSGSYNGAFELSAALCLIAAFAVLGIGVGRRVGRVQPAAAPA